MPSDGDKLDRLLMAVGETKGKVDGICEDVASIKDRMHEVVTRKECTGKHKMMEESLARTLTEVKEDVRRGVAEIKRQTGSEHPAITPAMLAASTPEEMERALASRAEARAERRRKLVTWYIGTAIGVLSLFGIIGGIAWKVMTTLQGVNAVLAKQPEAMRREFKEAAKHTKTIYVQVPVPAKPDRDGDGVTVEPREERPRHARPPDRRRTPRRPTPTPTP